jgi:hypothetical protein
MRPLIYSACAGGILVFLAVVALRPCAAADGRDVFRMIEEEHERAAVLDAELAALEEQINAKAQVAEAVIRDGLPLYEAAHQFHAIEATWPGRPLPRSALPVSADQFDSWNVINFVRHSSHADTERTLRRLTREYRQRHQTEVPETFGW